jgi:hypothetical protein
MIGAARCRLVRSVLLQLLAGLVAWQSARPILELIVGTMFLGWEMRDSGAVQRTAIYTKRKNIPNDHSTKLFHAPNCGTSFIRASHMFMWRPWERRYTSSSTPYMTGCVALLRREPHKKVSGTTQKSVSLLRKELHKKARGVK